MREASPDRRRPLRSLVTAASEREAAALDGLIAEEAAVTRPNTIAVLSPKGGVGKTTCTFLLGNLLAGTANLRCVAVDANPEFGTLGSLAPRSTRATGRMGEVFASVDGIDSAPELKSLVVARLATGLHLVTPPSRADAMPAITPELLLPLTSFLGRLFDVILLDLGITGSVEERALEEADQRMVVSTPDFATASTVLGALRQFRGSGVTMVLNQAPRLPSDASRQELEDELRRQEIKQHAIIPYDDHLRSMLNSGTYEFAALERDTRMSIGQLGLSAAKWLV